MNHYDCCPGPGQTVLRPLRYPCEPYASSASNSSLLPERSPLCFENKTHNLVSPVLLLARPLAFGSILVSLLL
jgi:hypothetical protein